MMTETMPIPNRPKRGIQPQWVLAALVALGLFVFFSSPGGGSPPEGWGDDPAAALAEARASNRKIVMGFYLPGCSPCVAMERNTLPAKSVRAALDGFVPVLVNVIAHADVAERYGVEVTPTYVVADSNGRLISSRVGYQSADEFVSFIRGATP